MCSVSSTSSSHGSAAFPARPLAGPGGRCLPDGPAAWHAAPSAHSCASQAQPGGVTRFMFKRAFILTTAPRAAPPLGRRRVVLVVVIAVAKARTSAVPQPHWRHDYSICAARLAGVPVEQFIFEQAEPERQVAHVVGSLRICSLVALTQRYLTCCSRTCCEARRPLCSATALQLNLCCPVASRDHSSTAR
jgi:hypothetical protein